MRIEAVPGGIGAGMMKLRYGAHHSRRQSGRVSWPEKAAKIEADVTEP
jgi:hypothetical protein